MSKCNLCKTEMPDRREKACTLSGDEPVVIANVAAGAVAGTSLGDFEICEPCYRHGLPVFFTQADLAEIHLQFGLQYADRERWSDSVDALSRALQIAETPELFVALGHVEEKQGNTQAAIGQYSRALEIDPAHFAARESLHKIRSEAA